MVIAEISPHVRGVLMTPVGMFFRPRASCHCGWCCGGGLAFIPASEMIRAGLRNYAPLQFEFIHQKPGQLRITIKLYTKREEDTDGEPLGQQVSSPRPLNSRRPAVA